MSAGRWMATSSFASSNTPMPRAAGSPTGRFSFWLRVDLQLTSSQPEKIVMRTIRPKCLDFALAEFYRSVHWDNGAGSHISKSGLGAQGGKSYLDRSFFTGKSMFQRVLCVSAFVLLFASGFAVPAAANRTTVELPGVTNSQLICFWHKIAVTNTGTGTTRNLESNGAGDYAAPALQPGLYTVMAEARGFKKVEHSNIRLEVGNDARIDFQLVPGALDETIQVTAEAPLITTTNDTNWRLAFKQRDQRSV